MAGHCLCELGWVNERFSCKMVTRVHRTTGFLVFFFMAVLGLRFCARAFSTFSAASGGHSSSRCAGLSLSRPLLLRSTGSRRTGSVVVAHGPSCSVACGIFPDQGSNPCPLHWQADSQPLSHQGSPTGSFDGRTQHGVTQTDGRQILLRTAPKQGQLPGWATGVLHPRTGLQ